MTKTGRGGEREGEGKGEFYPVAGYVVWIGFFRGERERDITILYGIMVAYSKRDY